MNLTRNTPHVALPAVALQSGGMVVLFAFVHLISDAVTGMLSALLPTIQTTFTLTETVLALLIATLSLSAFLTQPLFGALADRLGHRQVAALGVILNAILFSTIGIVPNVYLLFGLILVGGLGSAALHPAMASLARAAGGQKSEIAVGLFTAGGTLGIAAAPLIIMMVLTNLGLSFTPWLMIPGILFGVLIFFVSPGELQAARAGSRPFFDLRILTGPVGLLALVSFLANMAFVTFSNAIPLWLVHDQNLPTSSTLIGWTLSAFALSAALGGITGGMISTRLGARRLVVGSTLLALLPLFSIFFLTPGSSAYFLAVILAGSLINAGMPMLIVTAQDLAPRFAATAAGMLMGFPAGIAGLAYVGIGRLQEIVGLVPAMGFGYSALILAAILATVAIQPRRLEGQEPVQSTSCLCSPCLNQNISIYPRRDNTATTD